MATTLLTAKTGADASAKFRVKDSRVSVSVVGIAGVENADLQIYADDDWRDVYQAAAQVRLTATNNVIMIEAPGLYRVDKEVTASATGIYLHEPDNV